MAYSKYKPIDKSTIILQIKEDLEKVGILDQNDRICLEDTNDITYGYPIYDMNYNRVRDKIIKYLTRNDIMPCGRYGSWRYFSMEDTILNGKTVASIL